MHKSPETRASLLLKIRDPSDQRAWDEFVEIYHPVIRRVALRKGLQVADAEDVAQRVLLSVARTIEQRPHDSQKAKFRTWLHRVVHNAVLNALSRRKPDRASGGTDHIVALSDQPAAGGPDSRLLRLEHQREVFRWAARQVEPEFRSDTWQAFWWTAVDEQSVEVVAKRLGKNPGSIYAARSRVIRRIQQVVDDYSRDIRQGEDSVER